MSYTQSDVFDYIDEEDVRFIRLSFCDTTGRQKNIAIMPSELERAFRDGISFDASAIAGFGDVTASDLFLIPDPSTLSVVPWRSADGKVVRLFCNVVHPDGTPFAHDCRYVLRNVMDRASKAGLQVKFGVEFEFYLFKTDQAGQPTREPFDTAGYMDMAPLDKCENIRRDICLSLLDMDIRPETSHHEQGPGQNEIDFRYSDAMTVADDAFKLFSLIEATAAHYGACADFSPKPLADRAGNGMHINISVRDASGRDLMMSFMAGILDHIREITAFLNPTHDSYARLGSWKAPRWVTWSHQNRSQLIRIPAAKGENRRMELRSPDPCANPYVAFSALILAGLDGVERQLEPPEPVNLNLFQVPDDVAKALTPLPSTLMEAVRLARDSEWLQQTAPELLAFLPEDMDNGRA
jgi:glutamine synthetase